MAASDRKRRILEHIKRSSGGIQYASASQEMPASPEISALPPPPPTPEPPPPKLTAREQKQRIINHTKLSSGEFGDFSVSGEQRKRQIEEHLRKSIAQS